MNAPARVPWLTSERLNSETARVGARVIVATFAPDTVAMITEALQVRSLTLDADADDAQEAFLLAFYIREEVGPHDVGQGAGLGPVASNDEPVGPNAPDGDPVRADAAPVGVGVVGEGRGPLLEVRDASGLGNPWVRVWRAAWGLS